MSNDWDDEPWTTEHPARNAVLRCAFLLDHHPRILDQDDELWVDDPRLTHGFIQIKKYAVLAEQERMGIDAMVERFKASVHAETGCDPYDLGIVDVGKHLKAALLADT